MRHECARLTHWLNSLYTLLDQQQEELQQEMAKLETLSEEEVNKRFEVLKKVAPSSSHLRVSIPPRTGD